MRHFGQIHHDVFSGDVLTQGKGQLRGKVFKFIRIQHLANADGGDGFVRNFYAYGFLIRDGRFNTHTGCGQTQGYIIRQADNFTDLNTGGRLQLVACNGRPLADVQQFCIHIKAS